MSCPNLTRLWVSPSPPAIAPQSTNVHCLWILPLGALQELMLPNATAVPPPMAFFPLSSQASHCCLPLPVWFAAACCQAVWRLASQALTAKCLVLCPACTVVMLPWKCVPAWGVGGCGCVGVGWGWGVGVGVGILLCDCMCARACVGVGRRARRQRRGGGAGPAVWRHPAVHRRGQRHCEWHRLLHGHQLCLTLPQESLLHTQRSCPVLLCLPAGGPGPCAVCPQRRLYHQPLVQARQHVRRASCKARAQ